MNFTYNCPGLPAVVRAPCRHCQGLNKPRQAGGSAWWPACWSVQIWRNRVMNLWRGVEINMPLEESKSLNHFRRWMKNKYNSQLTCHISCTESVWRRGVGGRRCWPGPASRAACSASRRARSRRTGTRSAPARPDPRPRWRSGWCRRSSSSSREIWICLRSRKRNPRGTSRASSCPPHWPCGLHTRCNTFISWLFCYLLG